jgi:hypothetical protein
MKQPIPNHWMYQIPVHMSVEYIVGCGSLNMQDWTQGGMPESEAARTLSKKV